MPQFRELFTTAAAPSANIARRLRLTALALAAFVAALTLLYVFVATPVLAGDADKPLQVEYYGACEDVNGLALTMAGAGLDSLTGSSITLPLPGTVVSAWVFYNGADDTNAGGDPNVSFNGTPISATLVGGPALWTSGATVQYWSYLYRADVTNLVISGTNTLTGVDGFDIFNNGWELVVLYEDAGAEPHAVALGSGLDLARGDNEPSSGPGIEPVIISFDPAAVTRTAELYAVAGGVITGETGLYYEIGYGTPPISITYDIYTATKLFTNPFQSNDGDAWDTVFTDTLAIPPNATYVVFQARSEPSDPPNLEWILQTLQLPEACPTLALTKTLVSPVGGVAAVGEQVAFQIDVANVGNTVMPTVTLTDTFDATMLGFDSSQPAAPDAQATGVLTWTDITGSGVFSPGDHIVYTLTFDALAADLNPTINTATAVGQDANGKSAPPVSDDDDVLIREGIAIDKVTSAVADHGNDQYTVRYRVEVVNTSLVTQTYTLSDTFDFDSDFSVLTVTVDSAPAGVTVNPGFDGAGDPLIAANVDLGSGQTHIYELTAHVDASASPDSKAAISLCDASYPTPGTGLYNKAILQRGDDLLEADTCPPAGGEPALTIDKSAGEAVDLGNDVYQVIYRITVKNAGEKATTYDLTDTPNFSSTLAIVNPAILRDADGVESNITLTNSAVVTLATDVAIGPGDLHTYDLIVTVDASAATNPPAAINACSPSNPAPNVGLYNLATVTSDGVSRSDDACPPADGGDVFISKQVTSLEDNGGGRYTVKYDIIVDNTGDVTETYNLSDTFDFDSDFSVVLPITVTTTAGVAPNPGFNGGAAPELASGVSIDARTKHIWSIEVVVDYTGPDAAADINACAPVDPTAATGLYNKAILTVNGVERTDEACPNTNQGAVIFSKIASQVAYTGVNTVTVRYEIQVENTGLLTETYDISDTFDFDSDFVVVGSPTVTTTAGVTPNPGFDGDADPDLAASVPISGGVVHIWAIEVQVNIDADPGSLEACAPDNPTPGTGLFNETTVTVNGLPVTDDACPDVIHPSILVNKTPDFQQVVSGDTVTFTIAVTNTGDVTLTNIAITDALVPNCAKSNAGDLSPGAMTSYLCSLANVTLDFTNVVTATGQPPVGPPVSDDDDAVVDVIHPAILVNKTPDLQQVASGDAVTFTIAVTNTGDVTLTNVAITDALVPNCAKSNVGDLSPGAMTSYLCSLANVTLDFTNVVTATGQPPVGPPVSDDDDAVVDVIHPAILINKTPDFQQVVSGDTVTFTIQVTNTGDITLSNVSVVDPLAADCGRTLGTLAPGVMATYQCTKVNVTNPFTNVAAVTGEPPVGPPVVDDDDAVVEVIHPDILVTKTPDFQQVSSGDTVTFTIAVTNTGDITLTNVSVTDPLALDCEASLGTLGPGATTNYQCAVTNVTATFTNVATATGEPPVGPPVSDDDDAVVEVVQACQSIDPFEPNDTPAQAVSLDPDGTIHQLDFGFDGDQNWFKFEAEAGVTYTMTTLNLDTLADTIMFLFEPPNFNELDAIASSDDYDPPSLASQIVWTAPESKTYYFMIRDWADVGDCNRYDLKFERDYKLFLPIIIISYPEPTPTPTPTVTPTIDIPVTPVGTPIPGLTHPKGVDVNPTTHRVYIASRDNDMLYVVSGLGFNVLAQIPVCDQPFGVAANSVTNKIYVACFGDGKVAVINGATNTLIKTIDVAPELTYVAINETTNRVFVVSHGIRGVARINGGSDTLETFSGAGAGAFGIAVNENLNRLYVTARDENALVTIDANTMTPLDSQRYVFPDRGVPWGVGFNPVLNRLYVTYTADRGVLNKMAVFDVSGSGVLFKTSVDIPVGGDNAPGVLGVNTATNHVFVPSSASNVVSVIHGALNSVLATLSIPTDPFGVAVDPTRNLAYVTARQTNMLWIIPDTY